MTGCDSGICEDGGDCMFNYQCQGCFDSHGERIYPENREDLMQYIDQNYDTTQKKVIAQLNREIADENEYIRRRNKIIMRNRL